MLNILSISYISIALIFLVYSIISYKKKSIIYAVRDGKEKVTVLKDDYYKMQLLFCVLNCILLILETLIIYIHSNSGLFTLYYIGTFWIVNYLLKFMAIKMKYFIKTKVDPIQWTREKMCLLV